MWESSQQLIHLDGYQSNHVDVTVEADIKPGIDIFVDGIVPIAKFFRGYPFFQRPGLSSSAVFISSADIECVISAQSAKSCEYIRGENLYKISKVRDIIYIR